ncbi:MAG: LTA synthase family protein [Ruminococcaceae bacterium]|nr:LTA synthase family protein [Oscillospiraceae bacterium]
MFYICAILAGAIVGIIDNLIIRRRKKPLTIIFSIIFDAVISNVVGIFITEVIFQWLAYESMFPLSSHSGRLPLIYGAIVLAVGGILTFIFGVFDGIFEFKNKDDSPKKGMALKIISIILAVLGVAAITGTKWGSTTFGNLAADQLVINLLTPKEGTSDDVMLTLWTGPVLYTAFATVILAFFIFSVRELFYCHGGKKVKIFSSFARKIVSVVLALALFIGGCSYGIVTFKLVKVIKMNVIESDFIEENYVDPRNVNMQFPEKKRNLIHIYLESMENSYASTDMGGYMDENLIEPLTNLAKEGYSFSHRAEGLGGPISTVGCTWSVASMINMNAGIPMKAAANAYGSKDNFLPGAITLGDILESQGYEQSMMLGSTARFGGLNFFYESHGNFNILDYDYAKENGWIPEDYEVWWGYEDDKLYEFAKNELTRLHNTGKPFNFVMETADTHFPDGYVSPNTPTPRDSQYANVIAYSASETEKFVRWIQAQPFYENTTIVIIGDHLSMDTVFFENFDENYLRTTFNLIINPAPELIENETIKTQNRWWCNVDMFPTILASMGVKIDGDRLGLGTNLFSDEPTLFEMNGGETGCKKVSNSFEYKSTFYNENIFKGNNEPFNTKNVKYY